VAAPRDARTYGNWRRPTSPGIGGLGMAGTLVLLGGLIVVVGCMLISLWLSLGAAALLALSLAPMLLRDRHGRNGLQRLTAHVAWMRSRGSGGNLYRSGPLSRVPMGTCRLPGLLAASTLHQAHDAHGAPFALLSVPSTGHYSAVLTCEADGASLVDGDQVDTWVAYWGKWLAGLAHEPGLVAASVTVETAPDSGNRLRREVVTHLTADAPTLARTVLNEVVDTYPAGSAQITTRIALTYAAAPRPGARRRDADAMAVDIGARLPGLAAGLAMTGAGPARAMTATELAETVRMAYDPAVATLIDQARADGGSGLTWADAGPVFAQAHKGHYLHDGACSMTWQMSEAPRGEVYSNVLGQLLDAHRDILRKRVTLLFRPHDAASAARIVERDRRDALFAAQQARVPNARDTVAVRAADQTAREEATGAGLVRFGMLITATVASADDLPLAATAVDTLAAPARVLIRPVYGSQDSAFAAALPLGLVLPAHLRVPQTVREAM